MRMSKIQRMSYEIAVGQPAHGGMFYITCPELNAGPTEEHVV